MKDITLKKVCPNCKCDLFYSNEKSLNRSIKKNSKCYKCSNLGENNPQFKNHNKRKSKIYLVGNVYGKLKVISKGRNVGSWTCQCSCEQNTIKDIETYALIRGLTKSCECLVSLPTGEAALNHLFRAYKNSSKKRNVDFKLTCDEFKKLTQQNCYYCGNPPNQKVMGGKILFNGQYLHNGIDRIDSCKGYITDNVRSCCKKCNYAKHIMTESEFLNWIFTVANHLKSKQVTYENPD